jgi:uncharacterized Zn-binding protein involved in type VI secretion
MPGVSRVTADTAGRTIIGNLAPTVFVNGKPIAVLGARVQPHGSGRHGNAKMIEASRTVSANGIRVCRRGDRADCNHPATGSSDVNAG